MRVATGSQVTLLCASAPCDSKPQIEAKLKKRKMRGRGTGRVPSVFTGTRNACELLLRGSSVSFTSRMSQCFVSDAILQPGNRGNRQVIKWPFPKILFYFF